MFHKITSFATLPDYILLVGFANGEFKQFDLKPLMDKYPPFATLKDVDGLYEQAKIDAGGYGIVWNDDLDISAEGIYEKGVACAAPDDVEKYRQSLLSALTKARQDAGLSQKQLEILSGVAQPYKHCPPASSGTDFSEPAADGIPHPAGYFFPPVFHH